MLDVGVHVISNEIYHSDPCPSPSLSRSTIADLINKTPAHAKFCHPRLNPNLVREEKDVFSIGTAAHSLFLEGVDCCEVMDFPDWKTKAAREAKEAARAVGKVPLLTHQYVSVVAMVEAAHEQLAASELGIKDLHAEGDSELSYIWREENGVYLRVRPDWISKGLIANGGKAKLILDYKTTGETADPGMFAKKSVALGYDIQASMYPRGVQAAEGGEAPRFIFMVQENYAPYSCSFIAFDPMMADMGKQKTEYGIFLWQKYLASGIWPGYPKQVCYADTPPWVLADWESKAENIY